MKELDEILEIRRDLNSVIVRLEEIKQMVYPKSQVISDMPRGGERKNAIEEYVIKAERLEDKRFYLANKLCRAWGEFCSKYTGAKITDHETEMLALRFYYGHSWKFVNKCMKEAYPAEEWNEQKLFRMYRKVLQKMRKSNGGLHKKAQ